MSTPEAEAIFLALVILAPTMLWAYLSQRRLTRELIEAERVRDNYRKGLSDECAAHALLIGRAQRAVEILSSPYFAAAPVGDVIDLLHSDEMFTDDVSRYVAEYIAENLDATLDGAIFHVCNELHCGFEIVEAEWHRQIGDEPSQGKEQLF